MKIATSMRARTRLAALVAVVAAATVSSGTVVTANAAAPSASAQATVADADFCVPSLHRTVNGQLDKYSYFGEGAGFGGEWLRTTLASFSFGGAVETPRTMTTVRRDYEGHTLLAVRTNGSLWKILVPDNGIPGDDDGPAVTTQVAASGWGGVRHITGGSSFATYPRLYALSTSGGFHRYDLTRSSVPRNGKAIATTGWGGTKFLTPAIDENTFDHLTGVTTAGALMRYAVDRTTGAVTPRTLKASGWGQLTHIATAPCHQSSGSLMLGVLGSGAVYGYYEANPHDGSGADITGVGQIGRGFTGLISN